MARTSHRYNPVKKADVEEKKHGQAYHVALYARISVEINDRPSESIENQLEIMKKFISKNTELSNYREFVDRAYTGTNFERPAFQKMIEEIKAGRINCVIVKDLSRLGRDFLETCNLIEVIFPFLQVRFISINDNYDTQKESCGNRNLEISVKNMVNDMYARDISKRVSTVRKQEIEAGRFTGSNAPYGYNVDNEHPLRRFIIDPPAAAIVREMFNMVLEGKTVRKISKELQKRKLTIPGEYAKTHCLYQDDYNDKCFWRSGTISAIFRNEAYIGNMVQGKWRKRLCNGESDTKMSNKEWIIVENTHEPIVTREVFEEVAKVLLQRREASTFAKSRTKEIPIGENKYAGKLYCGLCGTPMDYISEIKKNSRRYYFTCRNTYRIDKNKCKTTISEKELDKIVVASITSVYKSIIKSYPNTNIQEIFREKLKKEEAKYFQRRNIILGKLDKVNVTTSIDYERYITGELSESEFKNISELNRNKASKLKQEIKELDLKFEDLNSSVKKRMRWTSFLVDGCKASNLSSELLSILIDRIEVFEGHRIQISYAIKE